VYSKALEKDVKSDTSGNFRRLLISLLQGQRPETTDVNIEQAKQDAQSLIDAGKARFGTDESRFNVLLCTRSDSQLRAIINEYGQAVGKSIGKQCSSNNMIVTFDMLLLFDILQKYRSRAKQVVTFNEALWLSFDVYAVGRISSPNNYVNR
jgi:hypothetical protein